MKKQIFILIFIIFSTTTFAQEPSNTDKLFFTCKIWGYAKYFHSEVSNCRVNWDSVLIAALPAIKNSKTTEEFNQELLNLLKAAGQMEITSEPPLEELPPELRRNLDLSWFNEPMISDEVRVVLKEIQVNFRPHDICWARKATSSEYGLMRYPYDHPIIERDLLEDTFPDEYERLHGLFSSWNIFRYFNPYNYILSQPWDSTLKENIIPFSEAKNSRELFLAIKKLTSELEDAHVEGLTHSQNDFIKGDYYRPRLILKLAKDKYVVDKSDYPEIARGDEIVSVDGLSAKKWEDSLRPYISVGNENRFRRFMTQYILLGNQGSEVEIGYEDSLGNSNSLKVKRDYDYDDWFAEYHQNGELSEIQWKKFDCDVGYVNLEFIKSNEVPTMYGELRNTKAIIYDMRGYPEESVIYGILANLLPFNKCVARWLHPDQTYPGTFYWSYAYAGRSNNPVYYRGKTIILCNEYAQSASETYIMYLREVKNSIVVGSQSAGANGNVSIFRFSNDVQMGFSNLGAYYASGECMQKTGIVPDSLVFPTAEGIRSGRDEVLEAALKIAGCDLNTSVSSDDSKINYVIYPNPAGEYISIDNYSGPAEIYDVFGLKVLSINNVDQCDISQLPCGVYFVKIDRGIYKFIKH
jgi:hypothetical protein